MTARPNARPPRGRRLWAGKLRSAAAQRMVRDKVRIRFRKAGDLRLVSHHDLMRCFERMLRRAELPFRSTQGFNPKPRMAFALSLALGIVGCDEVVDLELGEVLDPQEISERLARHSPAGLEIVSVARPGGKGGMRVSRVRYEVSIPPGARAGLEERIAAFLAQEECWIERSRPRPRRLNLRPYVRDLRVEGDRLHMDLSMDERGTARPEEILQLLAMAACLEQGAILERTMVELEDEREQRSPADSRESHL